MNLPLEPSATLFKSRHFDHEIIPLCVRWYVTYKLSYRDLVEMMAEGVSMWLAPPLCAGCNATCQTLKSVGSASLTPPSRSLGSSESTKSRKANLTPQSSVLLRHARHRSGRQCWLPEGYLRIYPCASSVCDLHQNRPTGVRAR